MVAQETRDDPTPQHVAALFGGRRILRHRVSTQFDAHEMILHGMPGEALMHLVGHLQTLQKSASFEKAVGMSLRTIQRRKEAPAKLLSQEQSGRAWKFAEILVKATVVLGSQEEAEEWLQRPAMGLDQRRPIVVGSQRQLAQARHAQCRAAELGRCLADQPSIRAVAERRIDP